MNANIKIDSRQHFAVVLHLYLETNTFTVDYEAKNLIFVAIFSPIYFKNFRMTKKSDNVFLFD